MARFTLTMKCNNAAFQESDPLYEVGRILAELGRTFMQDSGYDTGQLSDANGNTVGTYHYLGRADDTGEA